MSTIESALASPADDSKRTQAAVEACSCLGSRSWVSDAQHLVLRHGFLDELVRVACDPVSLRRKGGHDDKASARSVANALPYVSSRHLPAIDSLRLSKLPSILDGRGPSR